MIKMKGDYPILWLERTREILQKVSEINDVDILSTDIQSAYLNASSKENVWFRDGSEFGNRKGIAVVIVIIVWAEECR